MNPITETRYTLVRYVVLWGLFAAAYAAAMGLAAGLSATTAALDGAIFGTVSGMEGLILWNVLKYGAIEGSSASGKGVWNLIRLGRFIQLAAVGILFVSVAVGAECLALYATQGTFSAKFAATIPARSLVTAAAYVCFVLWYSSAARSEDGVDEARHSAGAAGAGAGTTAAGAAADTGAGAGTGAARSTKTPAESRLERITVRGAGGSIEVINVEEIVYIQAEGDYVAIVTAGGRWLKEGTMKSFEEALPEDRFVRVHRSYIVAVDHISRIETSGRDHTVVLRDCGPAHKSGSSIRISDTGYGLLKRTLGL